MGRAGAHSGRHGVDRSRHYTYEPLHPPLARVFTAMGPAWQVCGPPARRTCGSRETRSCTPAAGTTATWRWHGSGSCRFSRGLARGVPLGSSLGGWPRPRQPSLLFTTLPPVLAHAGIATTDMAITSTVVLAVYCAVRWLDRARRQPQRSPRAAPGRRAAVQVLRPAVSAGGGRGDRVRWRTRSRPDEPAPGTGTKALRLAYRSLCSPSGRAIVSQSAPGSGRPASPRPRRRRRASRAPGPAPVSFPRPRSSKAWAKSRQRTARATSPTCLARCGARAGGTSSPWRSR